MADLKSLNELLSAAAGILDSSASVVRKVPLKPRKEYISKIGHALTLIFEIQHQIYKIDPKLEPEHLKLPSPFPPETNRRFGEILQKASYLCNDNNYQAAIVLYENYISENPPKLFRNMADDRIKYIKKEYGV